MTGTLGLGPTVDLVTFHLDKYLTVEGVKIGSGNWKSEMGSTQKPRIQSEK